MPHTHNVIKKTNPFKSHSLQFSKSEWMWANLSVWYTVYLKHVNSWKLSIMLGHSLWSAWGASPQDSRNHFVLTRRSSVCSSFGTTKSRCVEGDGVSPSSDPWCDCWVMWSFSVEVSCSKLSLVTLRNAEIYSQKKSKGSALKSISQAASKVSQGSRNQGCHDGITIYSTW